MFETTDFEGKVVLFELAALRSPGSIALAAGPRGAFKDVRAQPGVPRLLDQLEALGVPIDHPDFLHVQLLVFGQGVRRVRRVEARAWEKELVRGEKTKVLFAHQNKFLTREVFQRICRMQLIDRDFVVARETGGREAKDTIEELAAALKQILAARLDLPKAPVPDPDCLHARVRSLRELLEQGSYEALEKELAVLRRRGRVSTEPAERWFDRYGEALSKLEPEAFAAWVTSSPKSFYAHYLKALAHIARGWEARGGTYARDVSDRGWAVLRRELAIAREHLLAAEAIDARQPFTSVELHQIGRTLGEPQPALRKLFERAVAADPGFVRAYHFHLVSLYPKWGGSVEAARGFVEEALKGRPEDPNLGLLTLWLHEELAQSLVDDPQSYMELPAVKRSYYGTLAALAKAYPDSQTMALRKCWGQTLMGGALGEASRELARVGDPAALRRFGRWLLEGKHGLQRDPAQAAGYLVRAANRGDERACALLADCLMCDPDFRHDREAAMNWLRWGAEIGSALCEGKMGEQYLGGTLGPPDLEKALEHFRAGREVKGVDSYIRHILKLRPNLRKPGDPK